MVVSPKDDIAVYSLLLLWYIGMTLDPVIYIFLQDDLRAVLRSKFCRMNNEEPSPQQETSL